nr:fibronectin type III domain-containing protein [Spirochaetota bacterium]
YTSAKAVGLAEYTGYYFAVVVRDEWNNMAIYPPIQLKTLDVRDPVVGSGIVISNKTKNSMRVTWGQAADAVPGVNPADLQYRLVMASDPSKISDPKDAANTGDVVMEWKFGGGTGGLTWDMEDKTFYDVTGLAEGETYYFAVVVKDLDGNMSGYAPVGDATLDETPPSIGTGVVVADERSTSLKVSWGEADDNITPTENLQYKLVIADSSGAIDTKAKVEAISATYPSTIPGIVLVGGNEWMNHPEHGVTVTGLTLGNTYYFAVMVKDAAGNTSLYAPSGGTTKKSWEPIGEATFPLTSYNDSFSLKLNTSNIPYVAYLEGTMGIEGRVSVMKYNGGTWSLVGSAGFSGEAATSVNLEIASDGTPYVVYKVASDTTPSDRRGRVMKYTGSGASGWEYIGSYISTTEAFYCGLALRPSDNVPAVIFSDSTSNYQLNVQSYVPSVWTQFGLLAEAATNPIVNSIAYSTASNLYVSYLDPTSPVPPATPVMKVTVQCYNGSAWSGVGDAKFGSGEIFYAALALGSDNVPYVALMNDIDPTTGLNIIATVMKLNGAAWERVGSNDSLSGGQVSSLTLAISGTVPYVAFSDNANSWKASVMSYTGGGTTGWEAVGSRGLTADSVGFLSLVIDSGGKPYMAYRDVANSNKLTVVVYQ